jgi:hypothetical protein
VVASRDGQFVAEVLSTGTTTIFGQNGSAVGNVAGYVEGFSWDGSLAVIDSCGPTGFSSCDQTQARVIRWRDGTVIWTGPPGQSFGGSQPQPGGTSLAVEIVDRAHPFYGDWMSGYPTVLFVVSSDGRVLAQRKVGGILPG